MWAQDEPYVLPIPSLCDKDPVGTIGDEIDEESHLEGHLLELCACQTTIETTAHGHLEGRLLMCPPPVKQTPFLRTNSKFNVLGLVGFV